MHQRFRFRDKNELLGKAAGLGLELPFSDDISPLFKKAEISGKTLSNRIIVQPMEGYDSEKDGSPSELTERRYLRYAEGGSGMIWVEAIAVTPEGRSNPGQLMLHDQNLDRYKKIINTMREISPSGTNPFLVAQITHSGRYSKPQGRSAPLVPQKNALLDKGDPRILTDDELKIIRDQMVKTSKLAFRAGFDAVDIKACHGYLVHELLFSRDRKGSIYGGPDPEARFRFLLEIIGLVKAEVPEITVTTRLNINDVYSGGFGTASDGFSPAFDEPLMLISELEKAGIKLLNVTMGSPYFNPHITRPYDNPLPDAKIPDEHPLEGVIRMLQGTALVQKTFPQIMVVGSAYSWLRQFAPNVGAAVISSGKASFIGFGRNSFAYPSMPIDLKLTGKADPAKVCITCSGCTRLIRSLRPGGCVIRDRGIYGEELKKLIADGK
jgi:2,4-dienoyl-CoA reductase (NADPH2)